ncbi:MAG: DUF4248 domain-containing protein [Tannerellaceae bacterium]
MAKNTDAWCVHPLTMRQQKQQPRKTIHNIYLIFKDLFVHLNKQHSAFIMEKLTDQFICRAYAFGELAMLYCPHITPHSASRMLRKWIHETRNLRESLTAIGWRPYTKILTPKMVECVVHHLGRP